MYSLLLMAAGSGTRVGLDINKLLVKINGKEVIRYTLEQFDDPKISEKIIVCSSQDLEYFKEMNLGCKLVVGGSSRSESVKNGLAEVHGEYVLIHDGARPNVSKRIISEHLRSLRDHDAVITLCNCYDSVKNLRLDEVKRDELYLTQTPLSFKTSLIKEAYQKENDLASFTDDYLLFKKYYGINNTHIVRGEFINFKLTTLEDLEVLKRILD